MNWTFNISIALVHLLKNLKNTFSASYNTLWNSKNRERRKKWKINEFWSDYNVMHIIDTIVGSNFYGFSLDLCMQSTRFFYWIWTKAIIMHYTYPIRFASHFFSCKINKIIMKTYNIFIFMEMTLLMEKKLYFAMNFLLLLRLDLRFFLSFNVPYRRL